MKMMKNIMALALAFTFVFVAGGQEASAYPADANIMPVPSNTAHTDSCGDCHTDSNKNDDVYGFEAGQMCAPCHANEEDGHAYSGQGTAEKPAPAHGGHNVYVDDAAAAGAYDDCVGCHVNPADATDTSGSLTGGPNGMIDNPAEDTNSGPYVPTADTDGDGDGAGVGDNGTPMVSYLTPHMNGTTPMFGAEDCGTCHEGAMVAATPETDPDGDGLTAEYDNDPAVAAPADQDSDNDGMTDLEEVNYNARRKADLDINNPDTDGDGLFDGYEVSVGMNPVGAEAEGPSQPIYVGDEALVTSDSNVATGILPNFDNTKAFATITVDAAYGDVTIDQATGEWTYTYVYDADAPIAMPMSSGDVTVYDTFDVQYVNTAGEIVNYSADVQVTTTVETPVLDTESGLEDPETPEDPQPKDKTEEPKENNPETGGTGVGLALVTTLSAAAGLVVLRKKN